MNIKVKNNLIIATAFMLLYTIFTQTSLPYPIIYSSFIIANVLLFKMVYTILKHGNESQKRFSEHYYEDFKG